jgi:hypothetical protein
MGICETVEFFRGKIIKLKKKESRTIPALDVFSIKEHNPFFDSNKKPGMFYHPGFSFFE